MSQYAPVVAGVPPTRSKSLDAHKFEINRVHTGHGSVPQVQAVEPAAGAKLGC